MANPLTDLIRYSTACALALGLGLAAPSAAQGAELRHTVSQTDLCRVNPIRHAPLRASKDAVIEADLKLRSAIGSEVRARSQMEAAEERYAELQAAFAPRSDLRAARVHMNWARVEHRLAEARLDQAEARRVVNAAELELGKLQLMEAHNVDATHRYRVSRFEDQLDSAMWELDRASDKVERMERRLASVRADWEGLAAR